MTEQIHEILGIQLATPIELHIDKVNWEVWVKEFKFLPFFPVSKEKEHMEAAIQEMKDLLLSQLASSFFRTLSIGVPQSVLSFWVRYLPAPLLERAVFLNKCLGNVELSDEVKLGYLKGIV